MMIKKFFLIFLTLILNIFVLNSQQSLRVEYDETAKLSIYNPPFEAKSVLISNKDISNYMTIFDMSLFKDIPKISRDENDDMTFKIFKVVSDSKKRTIIIDKAKNTLKHDLSINGKQILIIDNGIKLDWEFLEESKKINNLLCNKAKVLFRGRTYYAWYSIEIPVSVGPWKFNGLPGLIIEIYDEDMMFTWNATKIVYPAKSEEFLLNFDESKYTVKTLKEHVDQYAKQLIIEQKIRQSKLPKEAYLVSSKTERKGMELTYEWEEKEEEVKN